MRFCLVTLTFDLGYPIIRPFHLVFNGFYHCLLQKSNLFILFFLNLGVSKKSTVELFMICEYSLKQHLLVYSQYICFPWQFVFIFTWQFLWSFNWDIFSDMTFDLQMTLTCQYILFTAPHDLKILVNIFKWKQNCS